MQIKRNRKNNQLILSQTDYLAKMVEKFEMEKAKPVLTPVAGYFKLRKSQEPHTKEEQIYMERVPYSNAIGCLMYAMVSTRPDLAHGVSLVSKHMANPGKYHWQAVKWILRAFTLMDPNYTNHKHRKTPLIRLLVYLTSTC